MNTKEKKIKMKFYLESGKDALTKLGSSEKGLSSEEAQKRLSENGRNKLAEAKGKSVFVRFLEQLLDPMDNYTSRGGARQRRSRTR